MLLIKLCLSVMPFRLCLSSGDCHLTVWSSWSSCQLTCLEGRSFETTGRQARSRAVIIQVMENQGSCPHQVFETQPCKGTEETYSNVDKPDFIDIYCDEKLDLKAVLKATILLYQQWLLVCEKGPS